MHSVFREIHASCSYFTSVKNLFWSHFYFWFTETWKRREIQCSEIHFWLLYLLQKIS